MSELISSNPTLIQDNGTSNLDKIVGLTNPLLPALDPKLSGGSVSNLGTPSSLASDKNIATSISGINNNEADTLILPLSSTSQTSISSSEKTSQSSTSDPENDTLTGLRVSEELVDNSQPDSLTNPSASQSQTLPDTLPETKTNTLNTGESKASVSLNSEESQANTDSVNNDTEQAKGKVTPTTSQSNTPEASITSNENVAIASTSNITDSSQSLTNTEVTTANSSTPSVISTDNKTLTDSTTNSSITPAEATTTTPKDSEANSKITISTNSTTAGETQGVTTSTTDRDITQLTSQSFTFNMGVFKVDETGKAGIDYLFDGGGYEGELGIFNLEGMEKLAQNSDAFIAEAARRAVSNSNLGYVVINDATEGARFNGDLPYDINRARGEYQGVKTFTMLPGDTFAFILVPNGANLQQVANKSATGDDARPLFSLPMANPNGSSMTGQIADVTGVGNTFVMEDLRVDKPGTDSDYNDIIFQVRGATGSAVSIDSVIDLNKDWRPTNLGKALTEYAKPYVTPENPKVGESVTDELYDSVFGNKDNQVDNNSKTGAIAPEVPKSDSPAVTTAPATSDPPKTETNVTSIDSGAIAPATEKPPVSVEEAAPVTDKTAVTSERENQPLDSGSTASVSPQQPVVIAESSSSVAEDGGAIAFNTTPINPDSAVVTDNKSGAIASEVSKSDTPVANTAVAKSDPAKTETDVTSTNSGESKSASDKPSVSVVETSPVTDKPAVTSESENKAIAPIDSGSTTPVSVQQPVVTTESASSVTGVGGAIVSNTPKTSDSAVVTDNNSGAIAVNPASTTAPNSVTADNSVSNENTGVDATSDLADNWLSQLNQELNNLDSQVQGELTTLKNTISTTTGSVNSQVQELGGIIAETKTSLNTSVESTGTQLSGIKDQMNGSVTSTRSQLDIIEMGLTAQVAGLETKLSENKNQLDSGVNGLNTQLTKDKTLMTGKVTDANKKVWANPTTAFRPQDHGTEVTPEQQQEINKYTSQLQKDRTNAIKAVETANTDAGNSAKTQFTALSTAKDKVINEAQAKLDPSKQSKDAAIKDVETGFTDIQTSISKLDSQFVGLQTFKDNILTNTQTQFNELEQLKDDTITQTQTQFDTLSNSWSDWVNDTKEQIKVWTQIADSEDRWFDTTSTNPSQKVGLPLVGIIDTGFSANNPDIDYSRITLGKDWVDGDANPLLSSSAEKEHGTQLLEVIAATRNNGIGIDGINDKSPLWLGRAIGSNNWAQSLIEFVNAAKASKEPNAVVNLSFDLTQTNPDGSVTTRYELTAVERAALTYAKQNNILIVTSTGNQGTTMSALAQATKEFDNIFVVGAAEGWQRAGYSSYGEVDSANYGKGVDILAQGSSSNGASGTSVAAAKVTGAVSLVWAANPGLNHTQVMDILRRTAADLNIPNWDAQTGMGLLNIAAAVYLAKATQPETYVPRDLQLVQETLKAYQVPEVYWPQFYEYYYRAELETKFTGSKFVDSAWTNPGWGVSASVITTERATGRRQRVADVFSQVYSDWNPKYPKRSKAESNAYNRANELRRELRLPEIVYVRYEVTSGGGDSRTHVWKEIDLDAKADYDRKVNELNATKKFVQDKKKEIETAKAATQKEIDALKVKIATTEKELQAALSNATNTQPAKIEELKKQLAGLKIQLADSQAKADSLIKALEAQLKAAETKLGAKTQAVQDTVNKAKADLEAEIKAAEAAIEARKQGFFDKLGASVTQFSKDLGEQIKSNLKGVDVGAVLDALKKIPVVGTVVNGIEGLIALVQGDWIEVAKKAINAALDLIPGGSAIPEDLVNISVNVGWALIDKNYEQALANTLKDFKVEPVLADTLVGTAWALKDGDWQTALNKGLSKAGFDNADKFVQMAWDLKDNNYEQAFKTGLTLTGFDSTKVDAFVNISSALKENKLNQELATVLTKAKVQNAQQIAQILSNNNPNDDRAALSQAFTSIGFQNAENWVDMAWDLKAGNLFKALSNGFGLVGFNKGQQWVEMAQNLKNQQYDKVLETGFQLSSNPDIAKKGGNLVKVATSLRQGNYIDAVYAGLSLVPGLDSLIETFKAIQKTDFKAVAKSLPKAALALASYF